MTRLRPWETLESEFLRDCAVFRLGRTLARSPRTGKAHHFYRIDSVDWVNVVPLTAADEDPNPALFANRCHTFVLRDVDRRGEVMNDGAEETEVVLVPRGELSERLVRGEIDHALVVAGLFWLSLADSRRRGQPVR